jgi:hypothetical protein
LPEAVSFESRRQSGLLNLSIIARFGFGRGNVSDRLQQSAIVEPVDPFEGGELDGLEVPPRPTPPNDFGLVESVDRLGERIVVTVADAADGRLDASVFQALGVFYGEILGGFNRSSQHQAVGGFDDCSPSRF